MKGLILVAHGSRREASNDEVRELAGRLSRQPGNYDLVRPAFLELAEPSIPDAIQAAVDNGATRVVILPYFLSAGRHVVKDIPAEVEKAREVLPGVDIHILPYLGIAEGIPALLNELASRPF